MYFPLPLMPIPYWRLLNAFRAADERVQIGHRSTTVHESAIGIAAIGAVADDLAAAVDAVREAPTVAAELADVGGRRAAKRVDECVAGVSIASDDEVAGNALGVRAAGNVVQLPS